MKLPTLKMTPAAAKREYLRYRAAIRARHARELEDVQQRIRQEDELAARCYLELSRGNPILNLHDAFAASGCDGRGYPLLAIARADQTEVMVHRHRGKHGRSIVFRSGSDRGPAGRPGPAQAPQGAAVRRAVGLGPLSGRTDGPAGEPHGLTPGP